MRGKKVKRLRKMLHEALDAEVTRGLACGECGRPLSDADEIQDDIPFPQGSFAWECPCGSLCVGVPAGQK